MQRMIAVVVWLGMLLSASICFAQQYTITDLGTLEGGASYANGINASGQVVGWSYNFLGNAHAFRTAANSPINPATDDLGTLGGLNSFSTAINASGQVIGGADAFGFTPSASNHAFRTAANSPINPATDDLGTLGGMPSIPTGINTSGEVVGRSYIVGDAFFHAFRTAANSPINPATDDLGTLGGSSSQANGINDSGQVVGSSTTAGDAVTHAFRTAANSAINPASDDLGTLGGSSSQANGVNASGQVVGASKTTNDAATHAFRTAANSPINPATDDLGTLGGSSSQANGINAFGQVVGSSSTTSYEITHAFLYSRGVMYDLNDLIPAGSGWELLQSASGINDAGQIAGSGYHQGEWHAFLLTPNNPYKAFVQPPINSDGSSIFKASRGVIPVKFTLTQNDSPTCDLPSATISVTRTAGGTIGEVDEGHYSMAADNGSNFRIDPAACEYIYNLSAREISAGVYREDISIHELVVGSAVFELE